MHLERFIKIGFIIRIYYVIKHINLKDMFIIYTKKLTIFFTVENGSKRDYNKRREGSVLNF